ncbi:MAG: PEGA domain-containing protein [Myxococcota bacterium]
MLLVAAALAQPVTAVPPGAEAVTVFLCARPDGCGDEWAAMSAHARAFGLPLLDFDVVAAAGPQGREALADFEAAMAPLRAGAATPAQVDAARAALRALPYTVTNDDLFRVLLLSGRHADAAGISAGRVTDLPPLAEADLARYLDAAAASPPLVTLRIEADAPAARVYVDGGPVGEAPVEVTVLEGWHRVSVERPGRATAWVGELTATGEAPLVVRAKVAGDDATAAIEAAVLAALRGQPPEAGSLVRWARNSGLAWVRFVELSRGGATPPEELVPAVDATAAPWEARAVWLDVDTGRFVAHGPGPAALAAAADPARFRMGLALGFLHLEEIADTDSIPAHDHFVAEVAGTLRVVGPLAVEARVGLAHSAQPYYLDADWLDRNVYPVTLAARLGRDRGPYATAGALVVVPYALGGQVMGGWAFAPAPAWRVGAEARGGFTDKGWLAGGAIVVARAR